MTDGVSGLSEADDETQRDADDDHDRDGLDRDREGDDRDGCKADEMGFEWGSTGRSVESEEDGSRERAIKMSRSDGLDQDVGSGRVADDEVLDRSDGIAFGAD